MGVGGGGVCFQAPTTLSQCSTFCPAVVQLWLYRYVLAPSLLRLFPPCLSRAVDFSSALHRAQRR